MTVTERIILSQVAEEQGISIDDLIKKDLSPQNAKDSILAGLRCLMIDLEKLTYHVARYFALEEITKETH